MAINSISSYDSNRLLKNAGIPSDSGIQIVGLGLDTTISSGLNKRDNNTDGWDLIVLRNTSEPDTHYAVSVDGERVHAKAMNLVGTNIVRRWETCNQGQRDSCYSYQGDPHFGGLTTAVDMCRDAGWNVDYYQLHDGMVCHVVGTEWCANYYKIYRDDSNWEASYRLYFGYGEFHWSLCDARSIN